MVSPFVCPSKQSELIVCQFVCPSRQLLKSTLSKYAVFFRSRGRAKAGEAGQFASVRKLCTSFGGSYKNLRVPLPVLQDFDRIEYFVKTPLNLVLEILGASFHRFRVPPCIILHRDNVHPQKVVRLSFPTLVFLVRLSFEVF